MKISGIQPILSSSIDTVDNKINKKFGLTKNINSIGNTTVPFDKEKREEILQENYLKYIKECQNILNKTNTDIYKPHSGNLRAENVVDKENIFNKNTDELEIEKYFNEIIESANSIINLGNNAEDAIYSGSNFKKEETRYELSDSITNSGKKELNTEQKLYFRSEKKRSFKNLIVNLISPFKFINRTLLPIKINFENKNINKSLNTFKFDNISNDNDAFNNFSIKLEQLNKTFTDNVNKVISKKVNSNNKIDIMIKYHTLEKALECKLVNDIKLINDEFKADLAKNKFQNNYSDLPSKIMNELNVILNSNIDELSSSKITDKLKNLIKEKINSQDKDVKIENFIDKIIGSIFNKENILEIEKTVDGNFEEIKQETSLSLTKELFNQLSKDEKFIGEKDSIAKVDNLIRMVSKDIYKNMGEQTDKEIKLINDSFYENIKKNDNGHNFLTRLFKNSSNNINYKWAQDAVVLLISYSYFGNKKNETTEYFSDGKVTDGGNGASSTQKTVVENNLKGIFSRLGLSIDDLDKSKDEVLRKYFANYFEHV
ncbi:hypothetical protein [Proteus sp. PR00224]|uniref:hypothetical protein n=1 Tax=Proteus sp. PR00224 TaxID=2794026 RepID=UPI0018E425FC|nr:hypothetical protein [Proteus sp. PR00224]MBI6338591.1 hypothetical protein [Proteus sp. PR00224]